MCSSATRQPSQRKARGVGRTCLPLLAFVAAVLPLAAGSSSGPWFYPDDPIQVDDDRAFDASGAKPVDGTNAWDFTEHTFLRRGQREDVPAVNVNTMDEVPDSSWFTNRIGRHPMSVDEIVRGPNRLGDLVVDGWPIVEGKNQGITPGYRIVDPSSGERYQVKFDPPGNPEMGSGAEVIGAALYHAFGYNVVEGYIVEIDPAKIAVSSEATIADAAGRRRQMTMSDVARLLQSAARQPNGKYRALASRYAEGKPLGYFKYFGTRPDDPNDIFPHEHRRELRGSRVLAAWLNHDDSRGINSLDMLQGPEGQKFIRHYMFDFGSILGSGSTRPQAPRAGNEYLLEWKPSLLTLATLGLYVRPWIMVDYPTVARSVGRFESQFFEPARWKPEYPNPAFDNMRPEDAFWAARIVAQFSNEAIRAVVAKARYSEPGAAEYVADTLIARRDKVLKTWLTGVNPIVDPALDGSGVLTFGNAAVAVSAATPPDGYAIQWRHFDNFGGPGRTIGAELRLVQPRANAPVDQLHGREFVSVTIRTLHPDYPHWGDPVPVYFRRTAEGWQPVGIDRRPRQIEG
jgi:hypothetical protein